MREKVCQLGNSFINKRTVVVYKLGDNEYELRVETQSGRKLHKAIVTQALYEAAVNKWQNGSMDGHDAHITERALLAMNAYRSASNTPA
jgi:hypothetical protein